MIDLQSWLDAFTKVLQDTFPNRIWFVGLQGSYRRGEATAGSGLDVVVILDELTPADVRTYGAMLDGLSHRDLICGFLSGKAELLSWEPSDLVQFYHDTQPIIGSLDDLLPLLDDTAVDRAIKIGACNVYHGCVHNMLHEKSEEILRGLYKSASFAVQAIAFRETGTYFRRQKDLRDAVSSEHRVIVDTFLLLKGGGEADLESMSDTLLLWAQRLIGATG
jgi:predicted nucleotidyltransferase